MSDLKLLDGVKVVDMSAFVAAPMAAEILAEYGADVVRIEPLTGDDIAGIVAWVVSLPPHVNINDIEVMPSQQANAYMTFRKQESETT